MPTKMNRAGEQQPYIPEGNGDASGEYADKEVLNRSVASRVKYTSTGTQRAEKPTIEQVKKQLGGERDKPDSTAKAEALAKFKGEKQRADNKTDVNSMTRAELAKELYKTYLKADSTPIGRNTPLTEQEYVKRYLNGIGSAKGFDKQTLQRLVLEARQGIYLGRKI